jgi:outer membrane protein assembly factor BamB
MGYATSGPGHYSPAAPVRLEQLREDGRVLSGASYGSVRNRGLSYADGKIFLYQADTTLVALDAKTGKVVWSAKNGDPSKGETGTSAPMVIKDKVFVGISGGEFAVRGSMTAYDMKTGKQVWRAYSIGPESEMLIDPQTTTAGRPVGRDSSVKTWQGDQWKLGGSTTWGWYSYDPELNLVYYGSANPGTWNRPLIRLWACPAAAARTVREIMAGTAGAPLRQQRPRKGPFLYLLMARHTNRQACLTQHFANPLP